MILHQLASRLTNVFKKYCSDPTAASAEASGIVDELYQSLGGCDLCMGKGYTVQMELCTCPRARQLEKFIRHMDSMPETHLKDKNFEEV